VSQLKVTQVRSTIGTKHNQRESLRSLGLKRIHQTVLVEDNPVNRGYVKTAPHLLAVEEVPEGK
jgi:large subunit ribosomal protein L30